MMDEEFEKAFAKVLRRSFPHMDTEDLLRRLRAAVRVPRDAPVIVLDSHVELSNE
jgi:hypothetical protein